MALFTSQGVMAIMKGKQIETKFVIPIGYGTSSLFASRHRPLPVSMATMYVTCSFIEEYWWPLPKCFIAYIFIFLCFVAISIAKMDNAKMWTMTRCHTLHGFQTCHLNLYHTHSITMATIYTVNAVHNFHKTINKAMCCKKSPIGFSSHNCKLEKQESPLSIKIHQHKTTMEVHRTANVVACELVICT